MSFIKNIYEKNIKGPLNTQMGKGVYVIGRSTIISQVITLVSMPIITRLFSPSDFGIYALYTSILLITIVFASLKYELAIPLPKKDDDALNLIILSFILIFFFSILFCILLIFLGDRLLELLKISDLRPFLGIILFSFFCAGVYQVLNYWAIRIKNYPLIGSTLISKNFSGAASKIIFGWMKLSSLGLIMGDLISQMTGITSIFINFWKKYSSDLKKVTPGSILSIARQYYRFPFFSLPSTFFNTLAFQLPTIILASNYGTATAGSYALASAVLMYPISILSSSVSQVYLGEIAEFLRSDPGKIRHLYKTVIVKIATIAIPVIILISISAPLFFPIIFGEAWKEAGFFCIALGIMVIFNVCFGTVSILHYSGFNSWVLGFDVLRTSLILVVFFFCNLLHFSAFFTIFLFSISMAIMYILNYGMNLKAIAYIEKQGKSLIDSTV